jgi:site-specific DNA recombinase
MGTTRRNVKNFPIPKLSYSVAVYLRVSTEEQAEQNISIPAQKSRIISYCHAKGWTVVELYIDDGCSGKDLERPEMKRLIEDTNNNKFNAVVVWKLDRLSRRQRDVMYLIEDVLIPQGIEFVSVTENFDTSTAMGRAMLGIMAVFGQLERETIVERVLMAKKEAAKQGRFGGGLPFGYDYDKEKKRLVINPIQAEAVKTMYSLYLTGQYGFQAIADIMTQRGFKGQKTNEMQKSQVKFCLRSPFVAGLVRHLDSVYPGQHEGIIPLPEWEKVQNLLDGRYTPIPVKDETNLLTGLIWCGKCNARMRFKSRMWTSPNANGRNYYYVCYGRAGFKHMSQGYCSNGYHSAAEINDQVIQKLRDYSFNIDEARAIIETSYKPADNSQSIATIKAEIKNIETQLDRWYTAYENGSIAAEVVTSRVHTLTERKTALEGNVRLLQAQVIEYDERLNHAERVLSRLKDLPHYWDQFTPEEKRGLIFSLVKKIAVNDDGEALVELDL